MLRGGAPDDGAATFFHRVSVTSFRFIRISYPPALVATYSRGASDAVRGRTITSVRKYAMTFINGEKGLEALW